MNQVHLNLLDVIRIKNQIGYIRRYVEDIEKKETRKHGKNPVYRKMYHSCDKINALLEKQSIIEIQNNQPKFYFEEAHKEINDNFTEIHKQKDKFAILRDGDGYSIPIDLIPPMFGIAGKIVWQDLERFILRRDRTHYLYVKMRGEQ